MYILPTQQKNSTPHSNGVPGLCMCTYVTLCERSEALNSKDSIRRGLAENSLSEVRTDFGLSNLHVLKIILAALTHLTQLYYCKAVLSCSETSRPL